LDQPGTPQFFDQQTQSPCSAVELALIDQPGEKRQVVGSDETQKLGLAGKRNEIHRQ
jgi:hypothetical protein